MRRDEVMASLREAGPASRASGVASLYLFGSHARADARPDSDVDVFVDAASDERFGGHPGLLIVAVHLPPLRDVVVAMLAELDREQSAARAQEWTH
jgi:predicted nucleotidyltransferase